MLINYQLFQTFSSHLFCKVDSWLSHVIDKCHYVEAVALVLSFPLISINKFLEFSAVSYNILLTFLYYFYITFLYCCILLLTLIYYFFISNTFINSTRLKLTKNQIKLKQQSKTDLLLLKIIYFLHPCYHPKLENILHVGEVKFTSVWIFFKIRVPFTSSWKLKISTFDLSAWYFICFHFMEIKIFW